MTDGLSNRRSGRHAHAGPSPAQPNVLLAVLLLAAVSYALLQTLVVPALPTIQRELGTTTTGIAWVYVAFFLAASVATPLAGRLGDLFGKKRVLVVILMSLTVGTLVAALATSLGVLILGRVLQGIGGGLFPVAFGLIRDELPQARVARGIASVSAVMGLGGVLGIVLAGPILERLSYHWLFWIPLVVIVISLLATITLIPESPVRSEGDVNLGAAALLAAWLICLLVGVSQSASWGWESGKTIGLLAAAALLLIAWVRTESRAQHPLVDMRVMRAPGVWKANAAAFLVGWGTFSGFVIVPLYVQVPSSTGYGLGVSATQAGLYLLPWTIGVVVGSTASGRMSDRFGSKWPLVTGSALGAAGFLALAAAHVDSWEIYLAGTVIGLGVGLAFASMPNLVVETVSATDTGVASGMNLLTRNIGGVIGPQIALTIVAASVSSSGWPKEEAFVVTFVISTLALVLATVTALIAPPRPARVLSVAPGAHVAPD